MTIAEADAVACKRDAEQRRAVLLARPDLNGIDRVEVDPSDHRILSVFFIRPVPPANAANPADTADAFGLSAQPSRIAIEGGTRIVGVKTATVTRKINADGTPYLEVVTDRPGDFSVYTLRIDGVPALDRYFSVIRFSFMAACPIDVDCRHVVPCEPRLLNEPLLDYMAKDYASFRRMLLDLLPQLNPGWIERNPSDLGMALARAPRLRGRPAVVLPGRGRQRGLSRDGPAPHLGPPSRPPDRLPDARRPERLGVRALRRQRGLHAGPGRRRS